MYFLKKVILGVGLLILIYGGSAGTQSSNLFVQGISFVGLLFLGLILFVFARMLLRGLGCLPALFIMTAIGVFMMYTFGLFNNGLSGTLSSISRFIGRDEVHPQAVLLNDENEGNAQPTAVQEKEETPQAKEQQQEKEQPAAALFEDEKVKEEPKQGLLSKVVSALTGENPNAKQEPFNPQNYPAIYIVPRILTADTLEVYGRYFKLFGIAAPEINQTCADARGSSYNCGRQAALWLKEWIDGQEIECHVIQQDTKGNMIGTCSYGPYDLGAALVNAGWAVAYTKYTDAYLPYEYQAQRNRRGLWQGQFYKPWDWQKIKQRKATIKVIRPKKKKVGLFG